MNRLDQYLVYAETHRLAVCGVSAMLVAGIAWADALLPDVSIGYLYLVPVLLSAAALNGGQIVALAVICAYLREAFDPLQGGPELQGVFSPSMLNPLHWAPGASGRVLVAASGFAMTGFFVAELNQRRRLLAAHLKERTENERQVRTLMETSPLAILTLDPAARIQLANESARQLLNFGNETLQGQPVAPYLPILKRLIESQHSGHNLRTNLECKGQRRGGEVFLAHVWLSTYRTAEGPGLAAVIWDASENLRDREGAGLDSMMATSRVLIGAVSHEIRNLAAAATAAHSALAEADPAAEPIGRTEPYRALGTLIRGLEKIASSGLAVASNQAAAVADLDTVLDEARIVIESSLRDAGIRLLWDVHGPLPLVQGDHHSLLQVFVNLARNSQQALAGCERREVRVAATVESDLVVVRVCDTGPGVAHPEELFLPFQRGAHSSGLGLYISRAILRAHGGGLRYEPQPQGSCFAVELWPADNVAEER